MGYDAVTMGNHDFDAGVDGFALQLQYAKFPVVVSNYDFTDTPLEGKTLAYTTIKKGGVKVGIFGLGIELSGLVSDNYFGNTKYLDPLPVAKRISEQLKKQENCELVVCLSHLGYEYDSNKISDKMLAAETEYIDLIIGGHTHTFLDAPTTVRNKAGREVLINQAGWAGLRLGCITYSFERGKPARAVQGNSIDVKY
ncbi:MAG TPA: metallophosphoesterase [Flavipsychrobacter sp.]|nr:metallophosphoesterase [Flavipsychrobacter sp.]